MPDENNRTEPEVSQAEAASTGEIRYELRVEDASGLATEYIDGAKTGQKVRVGDGLQESTPQTASPEDLEQLRRERDELRERYEQVEHHAHILTSPHFQQWVQERAEMGDLEPPRVPAATVADTAGYKLRASEECFPAVLDVLRLHASTMAPHEVEALSTNTKVFNMYYDRVKSELGDRVKTIRPAHIQPPAYAAPTTTTEMERLLRMKEVDRARVERPGPAQNPYSRDEDHDGAREFERAKKNLVKAHQGGSARDIEEAELKMVMARFAEPKQRKGGY